MMHTRWDDGHLVMDVPYEVTVVNTGNASAQLFGKVLHNPDWLPRS